jgi:hypothetical protein
MRSLVLSLTLFGAVSLQAQQAPPSATDMRLFASSDAVARLIAKARDERRPDQPLLSQRIVELAPYNVNLEYRAAVAGAAIHEREAELFYVVQGGGTMVTGGRLVMESRPNPDNRNGTAIEGGSSQKVGRGDFILVPPGTPHWFSVIDGTLVLMSVHLPMPAR